MGLSIHSKKRKKVKIIIILLLLLILCLAAFLMFEYKLSKVVVDISEQTVKAECSLIISSVINELIEKSNITYDKLVDFEKGEQGRVSALKINIIEINKFKSDLSLKILSRLKDVKQMKVTVPLGTIFSSELFSGRGPKILVNVIPVGSVATEINNEISSAGINQTRHQIILTVRAQISILTALNKISTSVSNDICIAETIIVGNVPESYTNIDANTATGHDDNEILLDPETLFNFVY